MHHFYSEEICVWFLILLPAHLSTHNLNISVAEGFVLNCID